MAPLDSVVERYKYPALAAILAAAFGLWLLFFKAIPPTVESFGEYAVSGAVGLLVILLIYKIAEKATGSAGAGLFAAALASTIQLYSWKTVAQLTHTVSLFFFFISILALLYVKDINWTLLIIPVLTFSLLHVYSLALIPIFLLYSLIMWIEQKEMSRDEFYFILTSTAVLLVIFLVLRFTPTLYLIVKQYISAHYYSIAGEALTLKSLFVLAGVIPIYLGLYGTFMGLKQEKKSVQLLVSSAAILFTAMLFNVVPTSLGMPYFALSLTALSGFVYFAIESYIRSSVLKRHEPLVLAIAVVILMALGFLHRIVFTLA